MMNDEEIVLFFEDEIVRLSEMEEMDCNSQEIPKFKIPSKQSHNMYLVCEVVDTGKYLDPKDCI
jgi:hypothetical protein